MATSEQFARYIGDQLAVAGRVEIKKMFGEYGIWLEGKYVGCICGDQLFIKDTPAGRAFAPQLGLAPPYKGAANALLVEDPEDAPLAAELLKRTWQALPAPRTKKKAGPKKA